MNFTDMIWEVPNSLPDDLCDELVKKFDEDDEHRYQGESGAGLDLDIKNSTEIHLGSEGWEDHDASVFKVVSKQTTEYLNLIAKKISPENDINRGEVGDYGYQIQKSSPGGHYTWHHDSTLTTILDGTYYKRDINKLRFLTANRVATFIYYLNDSSEFEGGRTQFYFDGEIHSITPKKGLGVWFPSSDLYTHRGEKVESGDKYLVTGWIHEFAHFAGKFNSTQVSRRYRDIYDKPEEYIFPLCDNDAAAESVVNLSIE